MFHYSAIGINFRVTLFIVPLLHCFIVVLKSWSQLTMKQ